MAPFDRRSPCAADALFSIVPLEVNGKTVGISGLCDTIAELRSLGLAEDSLLRDALIERAGRTNYIPPSLRDAYADALLAWYHTSAHAPGRGG